MGAFDLVSEGYRCVGASHSCQGQADPEAVAEMARICHANASVQTEWLPAGTPGTSTEEPRDKGACSISGGLLGLDSVPVYNKKEMGRICDALVEPLAIAIHSLDDIDAVLSCSAPADAEFSLGFLLRDVCSKIVL